MPIRCGQNSAAVKEGAELSCILRAAGDGFTVDTFLASTSLVAYDVFRRGEPKTSATQFKTSGINIEVSATDFNDLEGQVEDAIRFLKSNREELKRLRRFQGVEDVRLDFAVEAKDVFVQSNYLPPELLALAAELGVGIELSIYPQSAL